jgi:hypothetical protein
VDKKNENKPSGGVTLGFSTNKGLVLANLSPDFKTFTILKSCLTQYCIYNALPIASPDDDDTERVLLGLWQLDNLLVYNIKNDTIDHNIANPTRSDCPYMIQRVTDRYYMLSDTNGISMIDVKKGKGKVMIELPNTKRGTWVQVNSQDGSAQVFTNTRSSTDVCHM